MQLPRWAESIALKELSLQPAPCQNHMLTSSGPLKVVAEGLWLTLAGSRPAQGLFPGAGVSVSVIGYSVPGMCSQNA